MRPLATILIPLALTLVSCGGDASSGTESATSEETLLVRATTPTRVNGQELLKASGTVRARSETVLSFTVPGRVQSVRFDEGAQVGAGTILARLDPSQVAAATASAQAEVVRAQGEYDRQKFLFERGWVASPRIESAEASLKSARAQLRATRFDSTRATITSPVAGTILTRHVEPNQIVNPGEPIVTLAESARGFVMRVPVSDRYLSRLTLGAPAAVSIPALGADPINGQVVEIGARGNEFTGTFEVEVALPAQSGIRSGLVGDVAITLAGSNADEQLIAIPSLAVFDARAGEGFVFVEEDGKAQAKLVSIARIDGNATLISSGLDENARVIVSDVERLRPDQPVRLAE